MSQGIYKYVSEYLSNDDGTTQCLWQMKGPKDTDIAFMECWRVGPRMVIVQEFKSRRGGGESGHCVFADIPSNHMADDKPIIEIMTAKARELQALRVPGMKVE